MKNFALISCIVLLSVSSCESFGIVCPWNQYYDECGTSCEKTCDNYNNPPGACAAVCNPGCQCYNGYIKNNEGECVLPAQCSNNTPVCPRNQYYDECGTPCEKTCDNYNDQPGACAAVCKPSCQCYDGYIKNEDGECVLPGQCPRKNLACPRNQYYDQCGTPCSKTCDNYNDPPRPCAAVCNPSCQCYDGYVKNEDGECVLPGQCPNKTPSCPWNQYYNSCGTTCPTTCDNYNDPPGVCAAVCNPGCQCYKGYIKNNDGDCVLPSQCPRITPACPSNQYYDECGTSCEKTCDNYNDPPGGCAAVCNPGCQCYDGYIKNNDGDCVLPGQCPRKSPACPSNQYYDECGTSCEKTCDNYNDPPGVCAAVCNSGCQCYKGYIKNNDGDCVLPSQCPRITPACPSNQYYDECGTPCEKTCDNYNHPPRGCAAVCNPSCQCYDGYIKNSYGECVLPGQCRNNVIVLNR